MTEAIPGGVIRLDPTRSIVAAVSAANPSAPPPDENSLVRGVYAGVFEQLDVRSLTVGRTGCRVVVASKDAVPELRAGDRLVWGMALGDDGPLSDEDIASIGRDPRRARDVAGSYVLTFIGADDILMIASASMPHLLTRTDGPRGTVLSTRGLAGHLLAGRRPEISHAAVVELLMFDYVLGDGDVLEGSTVLDEASVHVVTRDGVRSSSYWPREERFAPGAPPSVEGFIDRVTADAVRLARAPGAWLGLTGGRDSTLLAACLHRAGVDLPAFTWGFAGQPEADTAARTAAMFGWTHHLMAGMRDEDAEPFAHLIEQAAWHEGRERARDFIPGVVNWPSDEIRWITGNGGEIGRAFYWKTAPPGIHDDPIPWLARRSLGMPRRMRRGLRERLRTQLELIRSFGRPHEDDLDVFYALERMHKWLPQGGANQPIRCMLPGFLEPPTVGNLLAVPAAERRSGAFFDRALAAVFPGFERTHAPPLTPATGVTAALGNVKAALNITWPRARGQIPGGEGDLAEPMLREAASRGSFTRSVLGGRWWEAELNRARRRGDLRVLWNALSIDAFSLFLRRLPAP